MLEAGHIQNDSYLSNSQFIEVKKRDDFYASVGHATRWGNRDLYPIIKDERIYKRTAYYAYWMTAGVCLSSWTLESSLIGYGLTAGQACAAVLVGSMFASLNAYFCGKVGKDHHLGYTIMARSVFYLHGSYFCIAVCCTQFLVYFGIQSYFEGQAIVIVAFLVFVVVVAPSMPGFASAVNGDSLNQGWTRVSELTYFVGYGASIVFYFVLNKILPPKGLEIQKNMPEDMGFVDGMAANLENISTEISVIERGDEKGNAEAKRQEANV